MFILVEAGLYLSIKNDFQKKRVFGPIQFFKQSSNGRDDCLVKYEAYLRKKLETEGTEELKRLKGKKLGCWCKPERCHGDVIVKLIEELCQE